MFPTYEVTIQVAETKPTIIFSTLFMFIFKILVLIIDIMIHIPKELDNVL